MRTEWTELPECKMGIMLEPPNGGSGGSATCLVSYGLLGELPAGNDSQENRSAAVRVVNNAKSVNASQIPTIRGRRPINSKYAGRVHPSGVRFTSQGFPVFSPYAIAELEIDGLVGHYSKDAGLANKAAGLKKTPDNYVWHHVEDGKTMQLIPKKIHKLRHTGGAAVIRNGGFDK